MVGGLLSVGYTLAPLGLNNPLKHMLRTKIVAYLQSTLFWILFNIFQLISNLPCVVSYLKKTRLIFHSKQKLKTKLKLDLAPTSKRPNYNQK